MSLCRSRLGNHIIEISLSLIPGTLTADILVSGSYHLPVRSPSMFPEPLWWGLGCKCISCGWIPPWLVVLCSFGQLYIWSGAKGAQGVWMCIPAVVSGSMELEQTVIGPGRCCSGAHLAGSWKYFWEHSCTHEIKGIGFLRTLTTVKHLTRTDAWPCLENFIYEYSKNVNI